MKSRDVITFTGNFITQTCNRFWNGHLNVRVFSANKIIETMRTMLFKALPVQYISEWKISLRCLRRLRRHLRVKISFKDINNNDVVWLTNLEKHPILSTFSTSEKKYSKVSKIYLGNVLPLNMLVKLIK